MKNKLFTKEDIFFLTLGLLGNIFFTMWGIWSMDNNILPFSNLSGFLSYLIGVK